MILLIQGRDKQRYTNEIDQMHRLRKQVFHERLGWNVPIINAWEVDGYDALDPLYVLSTNDEGRVVGGLRLLPTMGFNMLNDTFPELLPDGERFASPLIWECSRFTVSLRKEVRDAERKIGFATAELGLAMNEIGMRIGLTHVAAVYDSVMHRMLDRGGCAGDLLSEPRQIGGVTTMAVVYEIGPELSERLKLASGITGDVLPPDSLLSGLAQAA